MVRDIEKIIERGKNRERKFKCFKVIIALFVL
jgi:hypothetical protein